MRRERTTGPGEAARTCDLAVLVNEFPKLSETFVLADLLALEDQGVRLHVFSLRRPQGDVAQDGTGRLRAKVEYLPEIAGRQLKLLIRAVQSAMLVRDPRGYLLGLGEIYASPDFSRLRLQQASLLARGLMRVGTPPLYIHFAHKPATVGRFASLLLGTPFAISAHAVDVWTPSARELRTKLRDAEVVLACYEEARQFLAGLAGSHTPVELVRHGVEIPTEPRRAQRSPAVLLAIGRLVPKKGFDSLLRAAAVLRDQGAGFRVEIAGEGPMWSALQRLVGELDLHDHVRFLGPLTHDELEPHLSAATVFVLPCQVEDDGNRDGVPNTVLEAMAYGVPVVSTTLASIREVIDDGSEGLLVPPRDPAALAAALARLLQDRSLAERLGRAARERAMREHDRELHAPRVFETLVSAGMITPNGS